MESITYQTTLGLIMFFVAIVLVALFFWDKRRNSLRRMTRMMASVGLDPEATDQETLATMKAVTALCNTCNCEDYCERWLKGDVSGSNEFCPNAQTFEKLKSSATPKLTTQTTASAL